MASKSEWAESQVRRRMAKIGEELDGINKEIVRLENLIAADDVVVRMPITPETLFRELFSQVKMYQDHIEICFRDGKALIIERKKQRNSWLLPSWDKKYLD